ncbi:MAG: hypothetical protein MPJ50_11525 [Pirellulales bacterium]|nr:hypothetical protein [Pirellulales bacterium]
MRLQKLPRSVPDLSTPVDIQAAVDRPETAQRVCSTAFLGLRNMNQGDILAA